MKVEQSCYVMTAELCELTGLGLFYYAIWSSWDTEVYTKINICNIMYQITNFYIFISLNA